MDVGTVLRLLQSEIGLAIGAIAFLYVIAGTSEEKDRDEVILSWITRFFSAIGSLLSLLGEGLVILLSHMGTGLRKVGRGILENVDINVNINLDLRHIVALLILLSTLGVAGVKGWLPI